MPQTKPKSSLNLILIISAVVGVIGYVATGGDSSSSSATATTSKTTKKATPSDSLITDADYKASFQPLGLATKDTFKPLIAKTMNIPLGGMAAVDKSILGIPTDLTGGEPNWSFTGTVAVNGQTQALVENKTSGQGDFLKAGEKWKTATVAKVTENLLILRDLSGNLRSIMVQADAEELIAQQQANLMEANPNSTASTSAPGGAGTVTPVNPGIAGPIGGNLAVQPDPNAAAAADPNANPNAQPQFGGRRRGRRGNRGGNQGGNQN